MTEASVTNGRVRARVLAVGLTTMLALGACSWRPAAAEVEGERIELADLRDDVALLRAHPGLGAILLNETQPPSGNDERADGALLARLLSDRIQRTVVAEEFERRGIDVASLPERQELDSQAAGAIEQANAAGFSIERTPAVDAFLSRYLDLFAMNGVFCTTIAEGDEDACRVQAQLLFAAADVKVNPRYGTWTPDQASIVPTTPALQVGA